MFGFRKKSGTWESVYDDYQDDISLNKSLEHRTRRSLWMHWLTLVLFVVAVVGGTSAIGGVTLFEKVLTELAAPVGLVWLILLAMTYFCFALGQTWLGRAGLMGWLLLTLAGNSLVANWLISTLEQPYQNINPLQLEKFDAIIVLGGGTAYRPTGLSQFSGGGDRVGLAARLYHAGKTDRIICTGSSMFRVSDVEPHVREQAAELLIGLLVPTEKIDLVAGENTSEEMANLKVHFESVMPSTGPGRYGLITSASHLSRALRLAEKNGLALIAIPADVRSSRFRINPNLIVPGAEQLATTKLALKEYMAQLVGR